MGKGVTTFLAALMAVTLIVAGCGSSDDATTDSIASGGGGSTSKTDFVKAADSVCTNGGKRAESEFSDYIKENKIAAETGPNAAQFEAIRSEILVPALNRQLAELRALEVPAEDEDQVNAYFDAIEEGLEKVEEGDPEAAVESTPTLLVSADKLADEYGFKVCGQH